VPAYEELPVWTGDLQGVRRFADLPAAAQVYVQRVAEIAEVPVTQVSVGPEREQMIAIGKE
jgi:adenylosuccinate synthase